MNCRWACSVSALSCLVDLRDAAPDETEHDAVREGLIGAEADSSPGRCIAPQFPLDRFPDGRAEGENAEMIPRGPEAEQRFAPALQGR